MIIVDIRGAYGIGRGGCDCVAKLMVRMKLMMLMVIVVDVLMLREALATKWWR